MRRSLNEGAYIPRFVISGLLEALAWSPVVLITGPRRSGKTTLCKLIQDRVSLGRQYQYITFDNQDSREYATSDPVGFVAQLPPYVILDEIQLVPEIHRQLKVKVDAHQVPGRFILTGSVRLSVMRKLSDALVGRMHLEQLLPLAQIEIHSTTKLDPVSSIEIDRALETSIITQLFNNALNIKGISHRPRLGSELATRILAGGFPELRELPPRRRQNWYQNYLKNLANLDIDGISVARRIDVLPDLMRTSAAYTAQMLNLTDLASGLEISRNTVKEYMSILRNLYIFQYLPAWSNNRLKRMVKAPKLHFLDTGVACALLNINEDSLWRDRKLFGQMTETFVFGELLKLAAWYEQNLSIFHYRDRDRHEIDMVLERSGHGIVAIEVKTSATVKESDFRSLKKLREHTNDFIAGVVFYDGEWFRTFDENLYALPISALWDNS